VRGRTGDGPDDRERVERLLADAATRAQWPPTPDLAPAVLARLGSPAALNVRPAVVARIDRNAAPHASGRGRLRLAGALALAATLALAIAGIAGALGFRVPGLEIVRVAETPAVVTPPAGTGLDLGSPIPVADAAARDGPRLRLPASLPAPTTAFAVGTGDRAVVTVAWRAEPGQPTLEGTDLRLTLTALEGGVDDDLVRKVVGPGTTVEPVVIGADHGWWIAGGPHTVLVRGLDGGIETLRSAVAGDTLVFAREGTLYRLESSLGRDATVEVARSMP
jgi:hypothetical protein